MSEYTYSEPANGELNVGWLGIGRPFFTGKVERAVRDALLELARDPTNQTRGFHDCEFCEVKSPIVIPGAEATEPPVSLGNGEIRVVGERASFLAPTLIVHYIDAHDYLPPLEFMDAVRTSRGLPPDARPPEVRSAVGRGGYPGYSDRASRRSRSTASAGERGASVLAEPLMLLAAPAEEQMAALALRAQEPDLSDLDVLKELREDLGDSLELALPYIEGSPAALDEVSGLSAALLGMGSGRGIESLQTDPAWRRIRELAEKVLGVLRADGVLPDGVPFRLFPGRFASQLQPAIGLLERWPTIPLAEVETERLKAAWEAEIPTSVPIAEVDLFRIEMAARRIYADRPDILRALRFDAQ